MKNFPSLQQVTFETADRVVIVGDFMKPAGAPRAVLLLHMMPAVRSSWKPLTEALTKAGIASLAIDLRGHGESVYQNGQAAESKLLDYKTFTDAEHQASRLDVDAALNFLKAQGFAEDQILLAGASIGANLALDAMQRYPNITRAVALSPGLDYRGVKPDAAVKNITGSQKAWIVAAEEDAYSAESSRTLSKLNSQYIKLTIFSGGEHGTNLFGPHGGLVEETKAFLSSTQE